MSGSSRIVCLHHLFEERAECTPTAVAVTHSGQSVSYGTLNEWADGIACRLRQYGIKPGSPVGVIARREPATIAAMLGILKAGGAYLAIDPGYPAEHVAHIVADARLTVVLARKADDLTALSPQMHVIPIKDNDTLSDSLDDNTAARTEVSPESAALVVYTSGSTGRPKGVVISHAAAVARTLAGFKYRDGDLQKFSLSVVAHLADVFRPLVAGGTVALIPDAAFRDSAALAEAIELHRTTRIVIVPSHLQSLLMSGERYLQRLRTLETIIVGGEPLTPEVVRLVKTRLPGVTLFNSYGLSETSGLVAMGEVDESSAITVGFPLPGMQMYVLDENLSPVADGQIGEVCVSGPQLATDYLHNPAATDERFVMNPVAKTGARMYRTGDAGRIVEGGALELCGRWDDQVKVRGFRVSLHEIEGILQQHPAVDKAVVLAQPGAESTRLVAVVRLREIPAGFADIRQFVTARAPEYMVPAIFARVADYPYLPNGKIDRRQLAEMAARGSLGEIDDASAHYVAPRTQTEQTIAGIWANAFARQIGALDDFFDLGGDSLLAMRILSQIEAEYGAQITFQDLLDHPTPEAISCVVDARLAQRACV